MFALSDLLSFVRRWFGSAASSRRRYRHRFRPRLEVLEGRTTPANFTWKAAAAGTWENPNNWDNPDGDAVGFPNDVNDTAKFDGQRSNQDVSLAVNDITIGRIEVINGFTKEIKLSKSLTLKDGIGEFDSNFKLAPQNDSAKLVVDNSLLIVHRGTLGSTTFTSEIQVINSDATEGLTFQLKAGVQLGMNLVIGTVGGVGGKGNVWIRDVNAGFDGVHLTVTNNANITVNKDSSLNLAGKDNDCWILHDGLTSGYVTVYGTVSRQGAGEAKVELPFIVKDGGQVQIIKAALNIASTGVTGTNDASLYVESGGEVALTSGATDPLPVLKVADEAIFDGGKLLTLSDIAEVQAVNLVKFMGTSTVAQKGGNTDYGELLFTLFGANAKVQMTGGDWLVDVKGGDPLSADYVYVEGGNLEIGAAGTTLLVTTHGASVAGDRYIIFDAPKLSATSRLSSFLASTTSQPSVSSAGESNTSWKEALAAGLASSAT